MKKYKVIKDWHGFTVGELCVNTDFLKWECFDKDKNLKESHYLSIAEATKQGIVEPIEDKVDWRKKYKSQQMLIATAQVSYAEHSEYYKKLDAYLKILCYIEAANEGKEWGDVFYTIDNNINGLSVAMRPINGSRLDLIKLKLKDDAEAILEDSELVEALEIVYNVEK